MREETIIVSLVRPLAAAAVHQFDRRQNGRNNNNDNITVQSRIASVRRTFHKAEIANAHTTTIYSTYVGAIRPLFLFISSSQPHRFGVYVLSQHLRATPIQLSSSVVGIVMLSNSLYNTFFKYIYQRFCKTHQTHELCFLVFTT